MSELNPQAESLESLLSTAIGLLMSHKERIGYKPNSVIAKFVDECVERLKDWTYTTAAQPAQAGQMLTPERVREIWDAETHKYDLTRDLVQGFARAIEAAVLAKRVPMTEAQMLAAFAVAHPQDHADMQDGSPANAIERIGARAVYRRFERGIRAAERHHGIVGEKGGA